MGAGFEDEVESLFGFVSGLAVGGVECGAVAAEGDDALVVDVVDWGGWEMFSPWPGNKRIRSWALSTCRMRGVRPR